MDLKEFTKETLIEIVDAVNEANEILTSKNAFVTRNVQKSTTGAIYVDECRQHTHAVNIDFDVAVTATEVDEKKGGGGIKVVQMILAGAEVSKSIENQSISRIKYSIPLILGKQI